MTVPDAFATDDREALLVAALSAVELGRHGETLERRHARLGNHCRQTSRSWPALFAGRVSDDAAPRRA